MAGPGGDGRGDAAVEEAEGVRAAVPEGTSGGECGRGEGKGGRRGLAAELRERVGKWVEGEDADRIPAGEGGAGKHAGRSGEIGEERREGRVGEGEGEDYSREQEEGDGKDPVENANRKVRLFVGYAQGNRKHRVEKVVAEE